ncbi:MAG TPA: dethiobiotin synthase, partial [Burkholderiaceae bacterium]
AGTDTEIGKTLIASALVHALAATGVRAVGIKPIAAGAELRDGVWHNDDVASLAAASNVELAPALRNPYLFKAACAPHVAAALEGAAIDPQRISSAYEEVCALADAVVVEGVGGFVVPLTDDYDTADLARDMALPVVLVVGMRLGCLSHALLTAEAIAARGLTLAGWVANTVDADMAYLDDNIAALRVRLPAPLLGCVPRLAVPSAHAAAQFLDPTALPGWPQPL